MLKVVQVNFPFFDNPHKTKTRPAVLLTKPRGKYHLVIIAFVTSNLNEILDTDIKILSSEKYFQNTGLQRDSLVRLHKITTIPLNFIKSEIGELPEELDKEIGRKLKKLFKI